ncbi:dihydrofolate reductase family protein [Aureibacter tunicatorum]|uniref:Dihydrofolate reductase n=1 Tax=Aureibacter tunicatorum TaxID=866807 RepID=A0AAE3XRL5_9BACT|nr:dihydrofolate reductase family protein [Aureibacter tunicatorum]MDR6241385.1 dihydrofolate reductase [Aureibacter tunicatorum]BDD06770.1 diacylglycerol kinase [Aureibacter tunicatorum]
MERCNKIYIATSLDGFIADRNGGLDWLHNIPNPENSDFGFSEFISEVDAIVMGRNTFETVCKFDVAWPYTVPVFVMSSTMSEIPMPFRDKAELVWGKPVEIMEMLNGRGLNRLYIDGGITIQNFLANDLIDEMTVTTIPVLLGDGAPLFSDLEKPLDFELEKSEVILGQLVKTKYLRRRG